MDRKTIMVCVVVAVLGIAAAVAGFVAEATRSKNPTLTVVYIGLEPKPKVKCDYQSSPARDLAIVATVALVMARAVIISATGGCYSCLQHIRSLPRFARICVIISWITTFVAVILFIVGAALSGKQGVESDGEGDYYCYVVRPGIFSGAAIMTFVSVLLALVYDLAFTSAFVVVETSGLELGVEAQPITDDKKPPITNDNNYQPKSSQKL